MFNETTWKSGEQLVQKYLKKLKYKILATNFKCSCAELDIVALLPRKIEIKNQNKLLKQKIKSANSKIEKQKYKNELKLFAKNQKDTLIIVEVKSRSSEMFGKGYEAINPNKIKHLKNGAIIFQNKNNLQDVGVRFDVASVDDGKINYIKNAF